MMTNFFRTHQVAMTPTHLAAPRGEEIQAPLTLDQVLDRGVDLDQTPQQRTTVMRRHRIMSPVTKRKAESLQPSKLTCSLDNWFCLNSLSRDANNYSIFC